ncbi:TPA: hypothetical protein SG275_001646 [Campylobacter coli]|nr:hypothetical protein [Campylobacter coli]
MLTAEIADKLNISMTNISKWYVKFPASVTNKHLVRIGNCVFVHRDFPNLTKNMKIIFNEPRIDWSNKLPLNYMIKNFKINVAYCKKYNIGYKTSYDFKTHRNRTIQKDFFVFDPSILKLLKATELESSKVASLNSIQVSKNYFICF